MTSSAFEGSPLLVSGAGGPAVLLLAGGSESPAGYFPGLSGLPTICWDRPGTGHSPDQSIEGARLPAAAAALHRLIGQVGVGPVIVLGHSLGGAVAVQLLTDFPEDVAAAVLLDPTPVNARSALTLARRSSSVLTGVAGLPGGARALSWLVGRANRRQLGGAGVTVEAAESAALMQSLDPAQLNRAVRHLVEDGAALTSRLHATEAPVVVVTAGNRKPAHAVRLAHGQLAAALGGRLESWPGTDHIVHLQEPAKVRALVEALTAR